MRLTDHMSLGVLTAQFPRELVDQVSFETECVNARERALPTHVMVYYVLALALYAEVSTQEVLRCVVEGARWLGEPPPTELPTKSAISQARIRLGAAPLEALYRAVVVPVATAGTPGAWYRGWRVMSLDGTTLDVGDTAANAAAFRSTRQRARREHDRGVSAAVSRGSGLPELRSLAGRPRDRRGARLACPGDGHAARAGALADHIVGVIGVLEFGLFGELCG